MASSAATAREYDNFFQTTDTLAATERRAAKAGNRHGRPIALGAKLSAILFDRCSYDTSSGAFGRVYVAGADGCVRRVRIPSANGGAGTEQVGKGQPSPVDLVLGGPKAPLTCLGIAEVVGEKTVEVELEVLAGCWDKCVYAWRVREGKQVGETRVFSGGHDDFVKCMAVKQINIPAPEKSTSGAGYQTLNILLSGSADRSLVFWNIATGKQLLRIPNFHKTSLYSLALDVSATQRQSHTSSEQPTVWPFFVISASSDGEIRETEFRVSTVPQLTVSPTGRAVTLRDVHPTSVYAMNLGSSSSNDVDDDDGSHHCRLMSASADGTVAVSQRREDARADDANGQGGWSVTQRMKHGGHVRCLADEDRGTLYTGGRDEDVKHWELESGELLCVFDGHFDEVTGVVAEVVGQGSRAVSCSLDGTVRVWDQQEVERVEREADNELGEDGDEQGGEKGGSEEKAGEEGNGVKSLLTAEEEAELAELMEDSD